MRIIDNNKTQPPIIIQTNVDEVTLISKIMLNSCKLLFTGLLYLEQELKLLV